MSFEIYLFGYLILIAGLAIGANILTCPPSGSAWPFVYREGLSMADGNLTKGSTVQGLAAPCRA
jgi:hypothetical protein